MNEPRGQHYVPQVYLRAFADGDRIRVYRRIEKGEPKTFDTNVKNVAKRRDVYAVKTEGGRDRYIDKNFERVESLLGDVIAPVIQGVLLRAGQWQALKYLAAIQEVRSPQVIDGFSEATTQVLDFVRGVHRQNHPKWSEEQIESAVQKKFPGGRFSGALSTDPRNLALTATNEVLPEFAKHVKSLHGTIITSDAHDFVTSNRPVVWFDPQNHPPHPFYGINRQSPTIEVTYPLTRRKCLFLCRHMGPMLEYAMANGSAVTMLNSRTAAGAKEVYAYPTEVPVERQTQLLDLASEAFEFPLIASLLAKG